MVGGKEKEEEEKRVKESVGGERGGGHRREERERRGLFSGCFKILGSCPHQLTLLCPVEVESHGSHLCDIVVDTLLQGEGTSVRGDGRHQ